MQRSLKRQGERVSCLGKKMNTFIPSLGEKTESGCLPLQAKRLPSLSLSARKKNQLLSLFMKNI
jgi:hypothetical protein